MAISASWVNDSSDPNIRQGYVVRNGIDSASTGYRYDNSGIIYLDKNNNKTLDDTDLAIGSIVDTQAGSLGILKQDSSQPTLYKIKSADGPSNASGITVIFDADFNSGKPVAPPAPKVIVKPDASASSTGSSSATPAADSTTSAVTGPGSNINNAGTTNSSATPTNTATTTTTVTPSTSPAATGTGTTPSTSASTLPSSLPGVLGTAISTNNAPTAAGSTTATQTGATSNTPSTLTTNGNTISVASPVAPPIASNQSQGSNKSISVGGTSFIEELVQAWFPTSSAIATQQANPSSITLDLSSLGNQNQINLVQVTKSKSATGATIQSSTSSSTETAAMLGGKGNDIITGSIGIDLIDGGAGNDLIKAGDGDDIISGGAGADRIYGGFGKNTFLNEKDGSSDTLYVSSDQFLANPNLSNKLGNNLDGSKADTISSIDNNDKIVILGVFTSDLSFHYASGPSGSSGIGIYAKGFLEAIYTGGGLSLQQITSITTGKVSGYEDVKNSI